MFLLIFNVIQGSFEIFYQAYKLSQGCSKLYESRIIWCPNCPNCPTKRTERTERTAYYIKGFFQTAAAQTAPSCSKH